MLLQALFIGALAVIGNAAPSQYEHVVHEKRHIESVTSDRVRVPRDVIVPVKIGLTQRNLERGHDLLMDVSHPDSPNYGKHWTADEVHAMFGPANETVDTVKTWLVRSGIPADRIAYSRQGWLSFDIPAHQAEELLRTEYYEHPSIDGGVRVGCDEYSLPRHVSPHVDYIKPGVALSPPMKKRGLPSRNNTRPVGRPKISPYIPDAGPLPANAQDLPPDLQGCGQYITPACMFALYNIASVSPAQQSVSLGLYETGEAFSQNDLNTFFANYANEIPSGTGPILIPVDGGVAPATSSSDISGEANIDLMIAYALLYPNTVIVNYQDGSGNTNENDFTWVTAMLDAVDGSFCTQTERSDGFNCNTAPLTTVISASYAETELATWTLAGQTRACNEFMKLSLQGSTFVYSSADGGVAFGVNSAQNLNGCFNPSNNDNSNGYVFNPTFPSNCPYVLSVGATQINPGNNVYDPEGAMEISSTFSSSGGFSNYFPTPSYQQSAVNAYFDNHDPGYPYYFWNGNDVFSGQSNVGQNGGVYNRGGRGFPDVSANGANYLFINNGGTYVASGTSLSAPLWASVITLLNENRAALGKGPVGFIHPALYANPGAFHDIQSGSNPGCGTNGFAAVPGWDPITGLGTPNFPALVQVFNNLP